MEFEEYVSARGQELVRLGFTVSGDYQRAEDLAQIALMQASGPGGRCGRRTTRTTTSGGS